MAQAVDPLWWAHPCSTPEQEDEDEDDDEVGKDCHRCDENIAPVESAVLVQGVRAFLVNGVIQLYIAQDETGDFKYTPLFFHEECWSALMDNVREAQADVPPTVTPGGIAACWTCESIIEAGEELFSVQLGEIHLSPRQPTEKVELEFFPFGEPKLVCFSCMTMVDQIISINEDDDEEDD